MPIEYQVKCPNCGSSSLCKVKKPGVVHCNHCGSDFAPKAEAVQPAHDRAHPHKDFTHWPRKDDTWKPKKKKKLKKKKKSGWMYLAKELVDLID